MSQEVKRLQMFYINLMCKSLTCICGVFKRPCVDDQRYRGVSEREEES